jgi:enamine deaminase RidA (YjgF/YER057c/UK114 family)
VPRRLISSGSTFEAEIGYSRAVVDGEWVFVSGTTGFDYQTMTIADGLPEQTEQCLRNIGMALAEAGATFADVVRVTYVVPKADEFRECWPVLRRYFGDVRPAAMMISAGLADPRMRIEIEVTARIGSGGAGIRHAARSDAAVSPSLGGSCGMEAALGGVQEGGVVRTFAVGDRVVRDPLTWQPNEFDAWGRGDGVGVVVDPPFPLDPGEVDVRWPGGRCFQDTAQLLPAPTAAGPDRGAAADGGVRSQAVDHQPADLRDEVSGA